MISSEHRKRDTEEMEEEEGQTNRLVRLFNGIDWLQGYRSR